MIGQDVIYSVQLDDNHLLGLAEAENRVLLTKDLELYRRAIGRGLDAFYVEGKTEPEGLAKVAGRYSLELAVDMGKSHCPICNTLLETVGKEKLKNLLEPKTYKHYKQFWQCPKCKQIYWQGAHWERICGTLRMAQQKILAATENTKHS
jgi:uncharacterized protein with PIN domain